MPDCARSKIACRERYAHDNHGTGDDYARSDWFIQEHGAIHA